MQSRLGDWVHMGGNAEVTAKYEALLAQLAQHEHVVVAFSGGVDSSLLLAAAMQALGRHGVLAVTGDSPLFPHAETQLAVDFCHDRGIRHKLFHPGQLDDAEFRANLPRRCYFCKKRMLAAATQAAAEEGFAGAPLLEGSNASDAGDFRPGAQAVREAGVLSPLAQAGMSKAEVRAAAQLLGLPVWDKPSFACLATRFEYGMPITREGLAQVQAAEELLHSLGLRQLRVRVHALGGSTTCAPTSAGDTIAASGLMARIEVPPAEFDTLMQGDNPARIDSSLRGLGFDYVALDLGGYITGNMNRTLD